MALIKPQFEAGKNSVGKKGIIHDANVHQEVLTDVVNFTLGESFDVRALSYSPITGGQGNIEFIAHLKKAEDLGINREDKSIAEVVNEAHEALDK
ncbi:FtsJ family RNA-binding methyltransferase [Tetragenococcus muriaticus 3MR10-3]|uniref:FtsJ family RNA-binding methyltransferase n=2 Tax=Tetragenococcus muriaticus TaxID=64642 RepID=A0A091C2E7_9ENTE|nr:FtsJ family RNA-binding methyltransferase [Tetragenococcus muriaticus 3MR10-3]